MSEQCSETLLVERLQGVPVAHRTEWEIQWAEDGTPTGHAIYPVGLLCHKAADRIAELEAENKLAKTCLKELQSDCIYYSGLSEQLQAKLEAVKDILKYCKDGGWTGTQHEVCSRIEAAIGESDVTDQK